ncbi:hypothetical protein ROU17_004584 [Escherichia coli]|uniref:hypothetical protein n=1 Tax=Enterobacteriaceae TaxID=543 RepID=UPI000176AFA8|nr:MULTISPECIES: hypothetical protein [Enterobacteriaceae]AIF60160.1 hypothetical protein L960_0337 [Escherichia coli B7A]EDV60268.1 hypothetical protein EcB7A_5252 [Escherichia coli B7A]EFD3770289.1 hypothetical protein [Escherichia coli]EFV9524483.1 hypothetical protein [Shigella sonnei]EHK4575086.1 hypothetical protein [Escherichia coli]
MTQEEKVMFLMRLAVETFNAHCQVPLSLSHAISLATEQMGEIDAIYNTFEAFLDKKLMAEKRQ